MNIKIHEYRDSEDYLQELYDSFASAWDKSKFNLSKGYDPYYDCQCIRISLKDDPGFYSLTYTIEPGDANYVADRPKAFQTIWRYPNDHGIGVGETLEFQSTDLDEYGKEVFDYFDEIKKLSVRKSNSESKKSEGIADELKGIDVKEANESASFNKAYREFLNRCWRDTPNGVKPNYSEQAINFMLDCAHIANGTSVKGLPQQGYTLTVANIGNLVGDCLHLCYEKNDGDTSIDIWLNPHTQYVNVDMTGITDPESMYHVDFNARKNTADDFADFIENLPNYTGKSKKSEAISDELKGIDVKEGSILEDVVDWAEYEVGEGYSSVKEVLETLMEKGVYSGMTFLVAYEDGKNFFEEHKQEINEILAEAMADQGQFPELQDFDKEDPLCLGPQNQFCLSAFAFERVASDLLDMILDKE